MTPFLAVTLLLAGGDPPAAVRIQVTQLTIRRQIIVRVPTRMLAPARMTWREKKGPKCVEMATIAGAAVVARDSVDLVLHGGKRLRAQFAASCPALDFYSGFYVLPTADRRICADRDAVRARSGGACEIARFRRLTAMPAVAAPPAPPGVERTRARRSP